MADTYMKRAYNIMLGYNRPTFAHYPLFTGATMTVGIVTTPGAGVWGALIDVIAAAAITTEFWLMETVITAAASAFGVRELRIVNTSITTCVYQLRIQVTAATPNLSPIPMAIPIRCNPNANIQGQSIATNAADTTSISLLVATGL